MRLIRYYVEEKLKNSFVRKGNLNFTFDVISFRGRFVSHRINYFFHGPWKTTW